MKKIIRKITVLVCASVLFILPVSTAYAASTPVLVGTISNLKIYEYQNEPLRLDPGDTVVIADISNNGSAWTIPPGLTFLFNVDFTSYSTGALLVEFHRFTPSYMYMSQTIYSSAGFGIVSPGPEATYFVVLKATGTEPVYLSGYAGGYFN